MAPNFLRGDFAHDLAGDHRHLLTRWQHLQQALAAAGLSNSQAELELRRLECELDEHTVLEERGGFFDQILADCPELGRRVQRLVRQHRELRSTLRALRSTCRLAACESGGRDGWLAAFTELTRAFADHERAKNELLMDAERELGCGD
jgi:hypothetical protein